MTSSAHQR